MVGPIPKPSQAIMPLQLQAVNLISDQALNQIHAVSFVTILDTNLQARCAGSEKPPFFPVAKALGSGGWKVIFSYLTIKEIYTFLISSPVWAQCIDLNQLRKEIVFLISGIELAPNLLFSFERVGLHSLRVKSREVLDSISHQGVGKVEIDCLDLSGTDVPPDSIVPFIQRSPVLQELNLSNCINLSGRFADLIPGSLLSLKKLDLSGSAIGSASIPYLLYAATNMEEFNLSDYVGYNIHIQRNTGESVFTKLRKLNLNNSVISSVSIIQFLKAAIELQELEIQRYPCVDPLNLIGLEANSLLSLHSVSFRESALQGAGLLAFLKAAPNLENLDLRDVRSAASLPDQEKLPLSLRGFFDHLPEGSLPLLQAIDLGETDVRSQDVERLYKVAPNLKLIQLPD